MIHRLTSNDIRTMIRKQSGMIRRQSGRAIIGAYGWARPNLCRTCMSSCEVDFMAACILACLCRGQWVSSNDRCHV